MWMCPKLYSRRLVWKNIPGQKCWDPFWDPHIFNQLYITTGIFLCQILLNTLFILTQIVLRPHNLLEIKHSFLNKLYYSKVFESEILGSHTCFKANSYPKLLRTQKFVDPFLLTKYSVTKFCCMQFLSLSFCNCDSKIFCFWY